MVRISIFRGWHLHLVVAAFFAASASGQTVPSAKGGGQSLWVGAEYGNFQAGFPIGSDVRLAGMGGFVNFNWNHHLGIESHLRFLSMDSWNGETQQDYLAGPRYTFLRNDKIRPYALFQAGMVTIQYPFKMGTGTSFALAPGGGVEYRLARKLSVRASYEFQMLLNAPDFTNEPRFGMKPNGFIGGVAYRIR